MLPASAFRGVEHQMAPRGLKERQVRIFGPELNPSTSPAFASIPGIYDARE
jgi:hypothetical protein